jgi:hypothetical protein
VSEISIVYTPRPDATPEGELEALATVYAFILRQAKNSAAGPSVRDDYDGTESKRDSADE